MKRLFLLLLILGLGANGFAQDFTFGAFYNATKTLGEFDKNLKKNPSGIVLNGFYTIPSSSLSVGTEVGISMYSNRDFSIDDNGQTINVHEEDCYYSVKALVKYDFLPESMINPFVVGKIGFSTFFSDMVADVQTEAFEDRFVSHGTSFNKGIGVGLQLNLFQAFNWGSEYTPVFFEISGNKNYGTATAYRDAAENNESVSNINNGKHESKTNHIDWHFGFNFSL